MALRLLFLLTWLQECLDVMQKHAKVSKIYLETHRDTNVASEETLEKVKQFFADHGVKTSGGITLTVNERNRFETFCYSNPKYREYVQKIVEFTARHFDEVILDDFFFTNCKSEIEIEAKGNRSWTEYRLDLLDEVARNVIVGPARAVNLDVSVIVKYPKWDEPVDIQIVTGGQVKELHDLDTEAVVRGEMQPEGGQGWFIPPDAGKMKFDMQIKPYSYRAVKMK